MSLDDFNQGPIRPKFERTPFAQEILDQKARIMEVALMRGGEDAELGASDQIIEFAQNLAKKYPDDYKKCRALAEISGSGDYDDQVTMDDFDGADSVKKFLDRLEVEVSTP